jgi:addiction module RelE/StbE family toxin
MARQEFPIVWLPAAAEDLKEIHDYIGAQSQAYAGAVIDRIVAAIEDLSRFPRKGHRVADRSVRAMEVREWLVYPYRIVYRVRDEHVVVLAIIHGTPTRPDPARTPQIMTTRPPRAPKTPRGKVLKM